jgi:chemotaxis protein methyltransferase CheR
MVEQIVGSKPADPARESALADLELNLLLEAVVRYSGHDFRDFAQGTLKRRISERLRGEGVATISGLQERILHDSGAFARFMFAMSGGNGRVFRDASFFRLFRSHVVPLLRTYSFARIWVPNCARGEDAYSLAAVLREEGILERTMIYATDASELAIASAKNGNFEIESPEELRAAHRATGAVTGLSDSCEIDRDVVRFSEDFKKHIIFAQHDIVSEGSLNEFHVIVARGVLTQYNKALQFRAHNLFLSSLIRLGFLCLGPNESLKATPHERVFREISADEPIYRRMR